MKLPSFWVPREMRDEVVARAALIEGVVAEARLEVAAKGIKTSQADVLAVEMLHSFASAIRSRGEK